jgi:hypothetical protein
MSGGQEPEGIQLLKKLHSGIFFATVSNRGITLVDT